MTGRTLIRRAPAEEAGFVTSKVRKLIAEHSGIDVESVTAETHFTDDLGYDQLDVLELIITIENKFVDLELSEEVEQIEFVGDLIRQIEMAAATNSKQRTSGL